MSKSKSEEEVANDFGEFLNFDAVEGGATVTEAHASTTLEISTQITNPVAESVVEDNKETDKGQNPEGGQSSSAEKENDEKPEHTDSGHANGSAEKKEDNEEGEKKEDEVEEVYEVETILGHKKYKNGIQYHIKWKGYSVDDSTWENEGDVYAEELLEEYWVKHGNDQSESSASPPKRKGSGRKRSAPQTISHKESKKPRVSSKPRASRIKSEDSDNPQTSLESWEDQVIAVETVTRDDKTGDLLVYLKWNNGETSRHPAKEVNMRCPQKMIKFYEQRLTFAPPATHKS